MPDGLFIYILAIVIIILEVALLVMLRASGKGQDDESGENARKCLTNTEEISKNVGLLNDRMEQGQKYTLNQIDAIRKENSESFRASRMEQSKVQNDLAQRQEQSMQNLAKSQTEALQGFSKQLHDTTVVQKDSFSEMQKSLSETLQKTTESMNKTLTDSLKDIRQSNEKKLDEIRGVVNEKLDKTLNERLDSNFKQVTDNLGKLYESLGKLQTLSTGVESLNKTLTNVKTRGTWGEVQLGRILEQTLSAGQYDKNVTTKKNSSDPVEYAVILPSDLGETVYLPIDSKFPSDIYNHIVEASENCDAQALAAAQKELKNRVLNEARKIRDKYVDPPHTSDFGIMFLPTEGLYAEVLRIDGIVEECQNINVVIAGPTTITALLNVIAVGFRNAALNRETANVKKTLEAVKTQIGKLDEAVSAAAKKIDQASTATHGISERTRIMKNKMNSIGVLDESEADEVLGYTAPLLTSDE